MTKNEERKVQKLIAQFNLLTIAHDGLLDTARELSREVLKMKLELEAFEIMVPSKEKESTSKATA